ncbi:MAG: GTPase, partial [Pseudomonadota bacterium]|nr:GTPase [Pseudomonadota bacterium]
MDFTLAIVGRPNVGKSTLFNRLTGKKLALVDDRPGVTRDRREGEARLGELRFTVIDTAGLEDAKTGTLEARMRQQTEIAITQADMVLMLVDARTGLLPEDRYFADLIRKSPHEVVLAANKYEGDKAEAGFLEAFELGIGEPIGLSAEHGHGIGELYDRVKAAMGSENDLFEEEEGDVAFDPDTPFEVDPNVPLRVAILGRPNAGKSTLINHMLGEERMLTGPE